MAKPIWLTRWERQAPSFLTLVWDATGRALEDGPGDQGFGSGTLIRGEWVLTAAHVIIGVNEIEDRGFENLTAEEADLETYGERQYGVYAAGQHGVARLFDFDLDADLALLRLDHALQGVHAPLFRAEGPKDHIGDVWVLGYQMTRDRTILCQVLPTKVKFPASTREGGSWEVSHEIGANEGISGGAVFFDFGDLPVFFGVPTIGGRFASHGRFVHSDRIEKFLCRHDKGLCMPADTSHAHTHPSFIEGLAPTIQVRFADYESVYEMLPVSGNKIGNEFQSWCWAGSRALSSQACRMLLRREARPGDANRPGHLNDPAKVDLVVKAVNARSDRKLRLPTVEELTAIWSDGDLTPERRHGHVLTFDEYQTTPVGTQIPPYDVAEWAIGPDEKPRPFGYGQETSLEEVQLKEPWIRYTLRLVSDLV